MEEKEKERFGVEKDRKGASVGKIFLLLFLT